MRVLWTALDLDCPCDLLQCASAVEARCSDRLRTPLETWMMKIC